MGSKFLPLLSHARVVRNVGGAVKRFFRLYEIVELDKTNTEARPCVPVLRIFHA